MPNACLFSSLDGFAAGDKIDVAKLFDLPGIGMCDPYQVNEGTYRSDVHGIGIGTQGISVDHFTTLHNARFRSRPRQYPHAMAAPQQFCRQAASQKPGSTGEEYFALGHFDLRGMD